MKRQPKYKPRWHQTKFRLLLPYYYFKATKGQATWWVKVDENTAQSENGQLKQRWFPEDDVWIDLNSAMDKRRFVPQKRHKGP